MSAAVPLELPAEHSSPIHQRLSQHYMLVFHPIFHCTVHKCCYNFMDNICSNASSHVAVIGVSRSGKWPRFTGCSTSHCREKYFFSSQGIFKTSIKMLQACHGLDISQFYRHCLAFGSDSFFTEVAFWPRDVICLFHFTTS